MSVKDAVEPLLYDLANELCDSDPEIIGLMVDTNGVGWGFSGHSNLEARKTSKYEGAFSATLFLTPDEKLDRWSNGDLIVVNVKGSVTKVDSRWQITECKVTDSELR